MYQGWLAVTKVRLDGVDELEKFIKEHAEELRLDSVDRAYLADITKVYSVTMSANSKKTLVDADKDNHLEIEKVKVLKSIEDGIENINLLAETMGDIL